MNKKYLRTLLNFYNEKKFEIKLYRQTIRLSKKLKQLRKNGRVNVFISVPTHGNLGDQAIVYTQHMLFDHLKENDQVVEITNEDFLILSKYNLIKKPIKDNDLIVIDGGGNIGTIWQEVEDKMRDIVESFPNNKIIIFPNTSYYADDENGKIELKKSTKIYSAHKDLHIFLRENQSYQFMKSNFPLCNLYLCPDIVLYINNLKLNEKRDGILLCLRGDKEKSISDKSLIKLNEFLKNGNFKVGVTSTVLDKNVSFKTRKELLMNKWKEFGQAQIIITDRLHAMIFCAITATPCLALDNLSNKVKNSYEWISNLSYIKFCENVDEVINNIDTFAKIKNTEYTCESILPKFENLERVVKK